MYTYALKLKDGNWHLMPEEETNFGVMCFVAEKSKLPYRIYLNGEKIEENDVTKMGIKQRRSGSFGTPDTPTR